MTLSDRFRSSIQTEINRMEAAQAKYEEKIAQIRSKADVLNTAILALEKVLDADTEARESEAHEPQADDASEPVAETEDVDEK